MHLRIAMPFVVCAMLTMLVFTSCTFAQSCGTWIAGADRTIPGAGGVQDTVIWDSDGPGPQPDRLVVCGGFTVVSDFDAKFVAMWDGSSWSRMGNLPGSGIANALAIHNGELYLGGAFTSVDGSARSNLLRWTGEEWEPVLPAPDGEVRALLSLPGSLVVAGNFTRAGSVSARSMASWDGTTWRPLADGLEGTVKCLAVFAGELVAGGTFLASGTTPVANIARWDGTTWRPLAGGLTAAQIFGSPSTVHCLYQRNGQLFVGGLFDRADGRATQGIASWNGSSWLAGYSFDHSSEVTFIGDLHGRMYVSLGTWPCTYFLDGQRSGALFTPTGGFRRAFEWRGSYYVAGNISRVQYPTDARVRGGIAAFGVARWDGSAWHSLGHGMDWTINTLGKFRGDVIALGPFTSIGAADASAVARWDGEHWHAMGEGFDDQAYLWAVNENRLYVGGDFYHSGEQAVNGFAEWDGQRWRAMGDGAGADGANIRPTAMAAYQGEVYVSLFRQVNQVGEFGIFAWNGSQWRTVAEYSRGIVYAMRPHHDKLVVGGSFRSIGGLTANRIASWNGAIWEPLGVGVDIPVATLSEFRGELYAGVIVRSCIYAWNAELGTWRTVTCELSSPPSEMFAYQGRLIASGYFANAGFQFVGGLASWDGRRWRNLGLPPERLGSTPYVYGLQEKNGELIVGGIFQRIGGIPYPNWGRWRGIAADLDDESGTGTPDGGVNVNDLLYFLENYTRSTADADLDDGSMTGTPDGATTIEDLLYLLGAYAEGC